MPKGMQFTLPSLQCFPLLLGKPPRYLHECKASKTQVTHMLCHRNRSTIPMTFFFWKQSLQQVFTALALQFSKLFMQLMRGMQPTLYTQFKSTC